MYKMYVETGTSTYHSSDIRIENNKDGSVTIREKNLKITVLHNEVDMLNYFSSRGWELVGATPIKILAESYTQYVFSKKIRNKEIESKGVGN